MNSLRKFLILMLFVAASVIASTHLLAGSKHATKDEAQAMATNAADFLKKEGPDKSITSSTAQRTTSATTRVPTSCGSVTS